MGSGQDKTRQDRATRVYVAVCSDRAGVGWGRRGRGQRVPGPHCGLPGAHGDGSREAGQHALDDHHSLFENVLQAAHATRLEQRRHLHCAHPAEHLHKRHAHNMRVHVQYIIVT